MKVLIFALILPAAALCDEINIPADFATIQEAIDNASYGDTITVSPAALM